MGTEENTRSPEGRREDRPLSLALLWGAKQAPEETWGADLAWADKVCGEEAINHRLLTAEEALSRKWGRKQ